METKTFVLTSNYYPPYHVGGADTHVYHLANALANLGHDVHIIYSLDWYYLKFGKVEPQKSYPNHENITLHPLKSPIGRMTPFIAYSFGDYYPISRKIIDEIKTIQPDIIHHHNITGLGPFILNADAQKRIYTAHDYYLVCQTRFLFKKNKKNNYVCAKPKNCGICSIMSKTPPQIWRVFSNVDDLVSKIDTIITPSEYLMKKLNEFGVENTKMMLIPNFVPSPPKKIEDPKFTNYFLFVGRLWQNKGILELINVFNKYSDEIDAKLVIAGTGELEKQIKDFITTNSLQDKVILIGWVDEKMLMSLYKNALAVVIPSIGTENNPMVALEAISVGTPAIGSDQGGTPEILEKIDKKLIFKAGDLEDMKRVLVEYDKMKYPIEKVKGIYEKYYSVERYLNKYIDLIDG